MTQIWKGERMRAVTVLTVRDLPKDAFKEGDTLTLVGRSRGKGFQGVVKRHGFHGGPASHGQKDRLRAPGSIGATAPQRVIRGTRMPGQTGNCQITQKKRVVEAVDFTKGVVMLRGSVPGMKGSRVKLISR